MSATRYFERPLLFTRPGKDIQDRLDVHFNEPRWDDFDLRISTVLNKTEKRTLTKSVAQFNVGLTTAATQFYCESGVPFLRGENVYERQIDLSSQTFVPPEKHEEWKSSQVSPGDIVIEAGQELIIEGDAVVNLSGDPNCNAPAFAHAATRSCAPPAGA